MRAFPLAGLLACALAQADAHQLEFLYINANEGTASGGHAALRFDQEVYHFQHVPSGLLRITRDDFQRFQVLYGQAENRSLFGHRISVSDDTWALLRDGFNRRLLIEDEQFAQLESLERDESLLRLHLRQQQRPELPALIKLRGVGLFLPPATNSHASASLARLRERMALPPGTRDIHGIALRLRSDLEHLQALDAVPDVNALNPDAFQPAPYGYSARYLDGLSALHALTVLEQGGSLAPGALLRPREGRYALTGAQMNGLKDYRERLEASLAKLPASLDTRWGYPLLVGMARLAAIEVSLANQRLAVLDLSVGGTGFRSPTPRSGTSAAQDLDRAIAQLEKPEGLDERAYAYLERSANIMIHGGTPSPDGSGRSPRLSLLPLTPGLVRSVPPRMSGPQLRGQLSRIERAGSDYKTRLSALYPYELVTDNCVTALFRSLDGILGDTGTGPRNEEFIAQESRRRLGGHVAADFPNNIPFMAFQAVGRHWNVVETRELPSWRHRLLADIRDSEPWLGDLRESNVISARLYQWHAGDSAFLLFSDDHPWLGLVSGPVNAAVGLGQSLAGLATLPWDGGANLRQGLKGFVISLPEMVFFNIRKGSYPEFQP